MKQLSFILLRMDILGEKALSLKTCSELVILFYIYSLNDITFFYYVCSSI